MNEKLEDLNNKTLTGLYYEWWFKITEKHDTSENTLSEFEDIVRELTKREGE